MTEKWKHTPDKGKKVGTIFMNLKRFRLSKFIQNLIKIYYLPN